MKQVSPNAYWIRGWRGATDRLFVLQNKKKSAPSLESIPVFRSYSSLPIYYKVKLKCTLVQALRLCAGRTAYGGCRGIALLFLDHGTRRGEGSASRPGRPLPPGKTRYPLYRRLGGLQGRSGQVRKILPPTGIRSPYRPALSQSLYRLSYPAHPIYCTY